MEFTCLPDLPSCKLIAVPRGKIQLNSVCSIIKGSTSAEQNDGHDDGKPHCNVCSTTSHCDAIAHAEPDAKPYESRPADRLSYQGSAWVCEVAQYGASVVTQFSRIGCNTAEDLLIVEFLDSAGPWQRTGERMPKVDADPYQNDGKVHNYGHAHHHACEADAFQSALGPIPCDDGTSSVGLSDTDFENEAWDGQEEDRDQVRDEPLETNVVEDLRRVADDISLSNSAAHSSEDESSP